MKRLVSSAPVKAHARGLLTYLYAQAMRSASVYAKPQERNFRRWHKYVKATLDKGE